MSNDWDALEFRFRQVTAKWLPLDAKLYGDEYEKTARLIEAKNDSNLFRQLWDQRFDVNCIEWAEDFRLDSPLFRSRRALLEDALAFSKAQGLVIGRLMDARSVRLSYSLDEVLATLLS